MSLICIMYWALSLESFHKWCTSSCVVRYRISISSSNRRAVDRCSRDTVRVNRAEAAGLLQDKCSNCTSGQINIMLGYVGITFLFNPVIPSNLIQRLVNHGNLSCSYLKSPLIQEAYPESPGVMSKQRKHLWAEGMSVPPPILYIQCPLPKKLQNPSHLALVEQWYSFVLYGRPQWP